MVDSISSASAVERVSSAIEEKECPWPSLQLTADDRGLRNSSLYICFINIL